MQQLLATLNLSSPEFTQSRNLVDIARSLSHIINPFNANCSKLLLFKGFSAILV